MAQFLDRKDYPKVLVAIPTYEGKDYIFDEMFKCIKSFTYPNFDFIIIDNTTTMRYTLRLKRKNIPNVIHVPRGDNSRQALCNAQNYARDKCLSEGYDYLLFVESDLLPPPNTIEILISHNVPVVGVTYFLGTGQIKVPCIFLREWREDIKASGTRLLRKEEFSDYMFKGLKKVHGTGLGTTLIRRDIVSRYRFWYDERFDNKHSDVYFFMDLDNNNVPVYIDTDLIVDHKPSKWEDVKDR